MLRVNDGSGKGLLVETLNSDEVRDAALSIGGKRDDGKVTMTYTFARRLSRTCGSFSN